MTAEAGAGQPTVAAAIDVGSNSVLLLTVAVTGGRAHVLDEALAITRLGSRLKEGGRLDPAACTRTRAAVAALVARAREAGAAHIHAFATGAVRSAADGLAFARDLESVVGAPVAVLSGEEEAAFAYQAAARTLGDGGPLLVADVGGHSTELVLGRGEAVEAAVSLPLGALALTEAHLRLGPPPPGGGRPLGETVDEILLTTDVPARARAAGASLVVSGGSATALAAVDLGLLAYDPRRVHGHVLRRAALGALAARVAAAGTSLPGLEPGRAAILPAGAVVLARLAAAAGADTVRVSDHGVRHGWLATRLGLRGIDRRP